MKFIKPIIHLVREGYEGNIAIVYKVFKFVFNFLCTVINVIAAVGIPAVLIYLIFGKPSNEQLFLILYGALFFITTYACMGFIATMFMLSESSLHIRKILEPVNKIGFDAALNFPTGLFEIDLENFTEIEEQSCLAVAGSGDIIFSNGKSNRKVNAALHVVQILSSNLVLRNQVGDGMHWIDDEKNTNLSIYIYTRNIEIFKKKFSAELVPFMLTVEGEQSGSTGLKITKYAFSVN